MSASDYSDLYEQAGQRYNVDPQLLMAQGDAESSGNPTAVGEQTSSGRAQGIAQLMPATAKSMGVTDPNDPEQAIDAQARIMSANLKQYGNTEDALKAYHGGPNKAHWGPITNSYPAQVFKHYPGKSTQMASNDTGADDTDPVTAALLQRASEKNLPGTSTDAPPADSGDTDPVTAALLARSKESNESPKATDAEKAKPPGAVEDIARSLPGDVVGAIGAIPQIPAYAGNLAAHTVGYLGGKAHDLFSKTPLTPQQWDYINKAEPFYTGNTPFDALTQAGKAITTGNPGEQNPLTGSVLAQPQTMPGRILKAGISGAVAGPATGAVGPITGALSGVGGATGNELYPNNPVATIVGGMVAPGAVWAGNKLSGSITPEVAQVAQAAQERGVNIPPGLLSDSSLVNRGYSLLNRLGFTNDNTHQEFTGAAAKLLPQLEGENKLTNPVMAEAKSDIVKGYGQVADMAEQNGGTKIRTSTLNTINEMADNAVEASPAIEKFKNQLIKAQDENGMLSGAQYKKLTQTGSVIDNMQSSTKPEIKIAGQQLEKMLLNDLSESAGPEAKNLLQQTDKQYALWHLLNASRDDTSGLVSPAKFSSEAWKRNADYFKTQNNLRNPSETYRLAQIADQLKLTPSSGTAENLLLERLGGMAGSSLLGYGAGGGPGALGAVAGGYALGKGAGSALSSNWYRNYLINKATAGANQ
jgi:hypothetical protein